MESYTVIYRTGGTEVWEWRACRPVATLAEAISEKASIQRMGYAATFRRTSAVGANGIPTTYEGDWK